MENGESAYRRILISSGEIKKCILCKIEDFKVLSVHHIDKNRKNNNISNLTWVCQNCHYLIHHCLTEENKLMAKI